MCDSTAIAVIVGNFFDLSHPHSLRYKSLTLRTGELQSVGRPCVLSSFVIFLEIRELFQALQDALGFNAEFSSATGFVPMFPSCRKGIKIPATRVNMLIRRKKERIAIRAHGANDTFF